MENIYKIIKVIGVNIFLILSLVEIVSFIFISFKKPYVNGYHNLPTYLDVILDSDLSLSNALYDHDTLLFTNPISPHYIDTNYIWCTWHPKSVLHRQKGACFDVTYRYNELGTRGLLPNRADTNTIIFIGDSFVEGFGLDEDSTIANRVGAVLNTPVLNLGATGNFGTTQMSLVYEHFSKLFKHKKVHVLLYLENDFNDNDYAQHPENRYRPYRIYRKDKPEIIYKGNIDSTKASWNTFNEFVKNRSYITKRKFLDSDSYLERLTKLSYTRRIISLLKSGFKYYSIKPNEINFNPVDLKILTYDIKTMVGIAKAHSSEIVFTNLPSKFLISKSLDNEETVEEYLKFENILKRVIKDDNSKYISFYKFLMDKKSNIDFDSLYFSCDDHYSNYGNSLLSQFLTKNMY